MHLDGVLEKKPHCLKGEFSSQTYGLNMIAKVTEMNRKNFFFHSLFSTSAGGLAGNLVLA